MGAERGEGGGGGQRKKGSPGPRDVISVLSSRVGPERRRRGRGRAEEPSVMKMLHQCP